MPRMNNEYLKHLADESNETFTKELEKLYNRSKESNVSNSMYHSSGGFINVCRTGISKLVNRIRQFNTRRN